MRNSNKETKKLEMRKNRWKTVFTFTVNFAMMKEAKHVSAKALSEKL